MSEGQKAKKTSLGTHFVVADSGPFFCIGGVLLPLLSILAATAGPSPRVEFRAMSFDEPRVEVFLIDSSPEKSTKPETKVEGKSLVLYTHALTHPVEARCPEGRLTLHRQVTDAEGKTSFIPLASAPVPPEGGTFLAILHGSAGQYGLSLVPDPGTEGAGGTLRFFNLCPTPVAMNFPGMRQVIAPAKQVMLRPNIKAEDYGQGQFLLADGEEWKVAGGLRWLQLEDIRTLWFILPAPGQPGIVTLRGIEERINQVKVSPPATQPTNGPRPPQSANGAGTASVR